MLWLTEDQKAINLLRGGPYNEAEAVKLIEAETD